MNVCYDGHTPMYRIKYKSEKSNKIPNEWLVCENCFGKQEFFGAADEIESIVSLHNYHVIRLEINHLYAMTKTVSKKLKKTLLIQ
ncbi:hypothetical protein BD31_I1849 [Candidatus Nitrosopumilus salaria BD31]|jgi:hypothetical protein|uniref:Uncharacterized protein n=1 Tax=Candidatus Nitrosopumilus salarius BD31 TaxID=859350 RepID=I3D4L0_9ARCH|nr:hypothetical protein [Candidatus Nitrosopumilus salaria]EIJ66653.1 hypothetical protein BD31_I1849 [Candidatus Nitrosopumilus salaria BD31]